MATPITRLDEYRLLGRSGLRVSPLCLGTMTFGKEWGWGADRETSRAMFDRYAGAGGNFIDTANFYTNGTSETLLGEFLKDAPGGRERYVVGTKYTLNTTSGAGQDETPDPNAGGNARRTMMRAVEASLRRLQTDYLDLYWLHIWDYTTPIDEVMRGFDDLVRQGKVIYCAISDTPAWKIAQLNTYAECHGLSRFIASQMEYSLVQRDVERDILPMCRELGIGMLPWSPLGGGVLTGKYTRNELEAQQREQSHSSASSSKKKTSGKSDGAGGNKNRKKAGGGGPFSSPDRGITLDERKINAAEAVQEVAKQIGASPAQVALNWLLTRKGVTSIILGARTLAQLEDNLGCLDFTLDEKHLTQLDQAAPFQHGFPHDFIDNIWSRTPIVTGGASIESHHPSGVPSFRKA